MRKRSTQSPEGAIAAQRRSPLDARTSHAHTSPSSEVSSSRPRLAEGIPQLWHDRLLLATVDLPIATGGEAGVIEAMIACVASLLSGYEVGASLPDGHDGESAVYFRRSPNG